MKSCFGTKFHLVAFSGVPSLPVGGPERRDLEDISVGLYVPLLGYPLIAPKPPVRFRRNSALSASAEWRPSQSFLATRRPSQSRRSLDAHPLVLNVGSGAESSQNKGAARSN